MPKKCTVPTCTRDSKERGWCHAHYQRWKRLGHVQADRPLGRRTEGSCLVEGCERSIYAKRLCSPHYRRRLANGDAQPDQPLRPPIAGTGFVHHGYFQVPVPLELRHLTGGRTNELQHRLVMAQILGRPMYIDESVHHRNGDRLDNRPENLELWSRWQPSGQRIVDKVEYAVELLRRYRPDLLATTDLSQTLNSEDVLSSGFEPPLPP
jgi:hypothetical protein